MEKFGEKFGEKLNVQNRVVINLRSLAFASLLLAMALFTGCKGQQEAQQKIADLENKLAEIQKKNTSMDSELKKANFEISQLKSLMSKMGDVVVNLQKAQDERHKKPHNAPTGKAAHGAAAAKKKPAAKKHH